MKVVVTGGAGFIGSHVVRTLAKNDIPVISVDKAKAKLKEKNITAVKADIFDLRVIKKILLNCGASTVIHLVGLPSIADCEKYPHLSFQLNVFSTQNVVEAMRKTDVERIIFASAAPVYGYSNKDKLSENEALRPNTIYGFHKLMAEQILKSYEERYGLKPVIFRLFNVYGNNPVRGEDIISIFIRKSLEKEPLIIMGPNKFRDFIHIENVAQAFLKAYINNVSGAIINIGSGIKVTLKQLAEIVKKVAPQVKVIEKQAPDDGTGLCADITLARELINFNPLNPYKGIEKHIKKFKTRKIINHYDSLK